ncbi:MAG: proline dehydrogenase family protein [Candidatus Eisenbacteria bacterium]
MSFFDRAVVGMLPLVPRPLVRRFSQPYIAGTDLDQAIARMRELNADGFMGSLDVLGEHIATLADADGPKTAYLAVLDEIQRTGVDSNVSVKLTQLGLQLDPGACYRNIRAIVERAHERKNFVRIDMEDSSCTDATLGIYRKLRAEGFDNVGCVIQAMLRRSLDDVRSLLPLRPNIRICKGIYVEPWRLAYRDGALVNRNFAELVRLLLDEGGYPAIASHDERVIFECLRLVEHAGMGPDRYELQMLLGVREDLRAIVAGGHRLRVYVPFGESWYAYSIRRMRENPGSPVSSRVRCSG